MVLSRGQLLPYLQPEARKPQPKISLLHRAGTRSSEQVGVKAPAH